MTEQEEQLLETFKVHGGFLPLDIYNTVAANAVIPTVDFILRKPDGKFCLIIRSEDNRWPSVPWFYGGEKKRGESQKKTLARILRRETGIEISEVIRYHHTCVVDCPNPASTPENKKQFGAVHTLMTVYVVDISQDQKMKLDETSKDPVWYSKEEFESIRGKVPGPVIEALTGSGLINEV